MFDLAIDDISQKRDLEKYVFSDNSLIAYYATAFASHKLLYTLIETGSIQQKINVIEHGSSKHIKMLINDDNPIVRDRALKRAADLQTNIYHEYVSSEKIEILLNPYSTKIQLDYFQREMNPFVSMVYNFIKSSDDLSYLMSNEDVQVVVISSIALSESQERKRLKNIGYD
jgi:hypothetical protein